MIIAGAAQMQPPPQLQPEREPDMVELREAPQIYTNQEEQAGGARFMGSHTFQSRETPPVHPVAVAAARIAPIAVTTAAGAGAPVAVATAAPVAVAAAGCDFVAEVVG